MRMRTRLALGREGMENVAHGAETDHKQTKLGLGLQISIFSQRLKSLVRP